MNFFKAPDIEIFSVLWCVPLFYAVIDVREEKGFLGFCFIFNNNDFIPTAELDYCTEMDQPFLEGLLRGNSQLARQA